MAHVFGFREIWKDYSVEVIRHGPSGHWVGEVSVWWSESGKYFFGGKTHNRKNGDWQPKDTIISKRCADAGIYQDN